DPTGGGRGGGGGELAAARAVSPRCRGRGSRRRAGEGEGVGRVSIQPIRFQGAPGAEADAAAASDIERTAASILRLEENVALVIRGKREVIRLATVCLLARGHVLIEDVPGVGKTTLAQAMARSLGLSFQRIQFTSDLLPSDIIGVSIFNQRSQAFEFVPGPLFANVVLADEINRATPKTQSALLEART